MRIVEVQPGNAHIADHVVFQANAAIRPSDLRPQLGLTLPGGIESARKERQAQLHSTRGVIVRQMTVVHRRVPSHAHRFNGWQPRIPFGLGMPERRVALIPQTQQFRPAGQRRLNQVSNIIGALRRWLKQDAL